MFSALRDLSQKPAPVKKTKMKRGMSLRAFRSAQKQMQISNKITSSLAKTSGVVSDFADLRRLKSVASTQGLNKSLMLFVNPGNNVLSRITKNFPSNESLDAVSIGKSDRRTKSAIEGLTESLSEEPKLISDWTHASADDVEHLLSSVEDQLKDVGEAISHYLEMLESSDSTNEDLSDMVEVIPYAAAMARIEALLEILPDMDALVSDPTDRDAMDTYKAKISNMVEKIGPVAGLGIDPENQCLVIAAPTSDDYTTSSASLADLGYTTDNTIELLKKADQLIDEVSGLIERKESMVAYLHGTADTISQIDNTVPPAVDGAISEDEDSDVAMTTGGMTQADVYHSQVASHLYCLSVIVGVSIAAVQDVLVVASELSDEDEDDVVVLVSQISE